MHFRNLLLAAGLLGSVLAQNKLKIMPLGDSITEITCWRALLWDGLVSAGVTSEIQFVGSQTDNTQNCVAKDPNWDHHHEGHSGYLAINIANNNLVGWLAAAKPDVVQFMLGTNDVAQQHSTSEIIAAYTKMVQEMRASNPNMKILVDLVIPLPSSPSGINSLNAAIPAWAEGLNSTASPIYIVDCNTGFTASMLRDGVHPNAQGDALIESRILPTLVQVIKESVGGSGTGSGTGGGGGGATTTSPSSTPTGGSGGGSGGAGGTLPKYSQCAGQGWTGSGTCVAGTTCKYQNAYYSQCL